MFVLGVYTQVMQGVLYPTSRMRLRLGPAILLLVFNSFRSSSVFSFPSHFCLLSTISIYYEHVGVDVIHNLGGVWCQLCRAVADTWT